MSYSISFTKPYGADYTDPQYQDRITGDIWFTRLNAGGPLFNYKYYLDYGYVNPVVDQLGADFWYEGAPNLGGTTGVKWGILGTLGFPNPAAPGVNPDLFAVVGDTSNFFSFSQMCVLLRAMIDESSKPVSLVNPTGSNEWLLANDDTADNTVMPYLVGKDLCCYIPATNQYFKIRISVWGANGEPSITYVRTPLFYARVPFYTQVLHQNENYTDYKITYYTDNSSVVQVYQKNGRTNCYQYVGAIAVASCQSPVPYVPPTPPGPPGPPIPPPNPEPQVVSFSTVGSTTWTAPLTLTSSVEYLVVGGGGGGGGAFDTGAGGGGGAGLVLTGTVSVTPGATYNIVVGAGGIAGIGNRTGSPQETPGGTGGSSSFDTIVAVGGSGGYASRTAPGGVGLGGAIANAGTLTAGGGGNGGGNLASAASAGGGGGNGSVGGTSVNNTPGVGGSGISSSISGTSVTYGAGGSGGRENSNVNGANGAANTGNGAGGAGSVSFDSSNGGAGGSGIVILRFTA